MIHVQERTAKAREDEASQRFGAFASNTRLAILALLSDRDYCTVFALRDCLHERGYPLAQPTVSRHLRILLQAGLVKFFRDRKYVCYYCPFPGYIRDLLEALDNPRVEERRYDAYCNMEELEGVQCK